MPYRLIPPPNFEDRFAKITLRGYFGGGRIEEETVFGGKPFYDLPFGPARALVVNNGFIPTVDLVNEFRPGCGPTMARPTHPDRGQRFVDTTLGLYIIWNGTTWRHIVTGAQV